MSLFNAATSSAHNVSNSINKSNSQSTSNSWSNTAGIEATLQAIQNANNANNSAWQMWKEAAEFNSAEAQKQREWQEKMANSVYQRTTKDMIAAGINPVLAAANGFGSGAVSSGANASMAAPNTFMANTYPEMNSASTAQSSSESHGESHGEGWSNSESGLAKWLESMAGYFEGFLSSLNTGKAIEISFNGLGDLLGYKGNNPGSTIVNNIKDGINNVKENYDKTMEKIEEKERYREWKQKNYPNSHSSGGGHKF